MKKLLFLALGIAVCFAACDDPSNGDVLYTTITFDPNEGAGSMAPQKIAENTSAALTANAFTREGYVFTGWALTAGGEVEYADGASYTAGAGTGDVTLYAKWTDAPVTVITFNANGGEGTMQPLQIPENTTAALTANAFTRGNHAFTGWAETEDGDAEYADKADYTAAAGSHTVTLYAVWELDLPPGSDTVSFNANGGTGGQTATVSATRGQPMPQLTATAPTYEVIPTEPCTHFVTPVTVNSLNTPVKPARCDCPVYEKRYFDGYYDAQTGGKKYYNADLTSATNWDKTEGAVLYAQYLTVQQKYNIPAERPISATISNQNISFTGGYDDFAAYFAETAPTIDGNGNDPAWAKARWQPMCYQWMYANPLRELVSPAENDFSGRFKVVWTADRLYILCEIRDDEIRRASGNDGSSGAEQNDCFEVFIDENASGGARGGVNNFFAYHINFYNAPGYDPTPKNVQDYVDGAGSNAVQLRNNHLNYVIGIDSANKTYTWEIEMKIFNDTYPVVEPAATDDTKLVTLTEGKKMGFAAAYCDSDGHRTPSNRDHFIGSMFVGGTNDNARNSGYLNSSQYAHLYLAK